MAEEDVRITARKFRKKPVEIEAVRWTGDNVDDVLAFIDSDERWKTGIDDGYVGGPGIGHTPPLGTLDIPTLEGTMTANAGDWIIRGVKGEIYPCKPDVFDITYDDCAALAAVDALEPPPATTETVEYGRELQDGFVVPWSYRFNGGPPDLSKFPPSMNHEPTTWVQREITKWHPVRAEVVESSLLQTGCPGSAQRIVSDDLTSGEPVYAASCPVCGYEVNAYRDENGWYLTEHDVESSLLPE